MSDDGLRQSLALWRTRLKLRAAMLALLGATVLILLGVGQLSPQGALIAVAVALLAALFLPQSGGPALSSGTDIEVSEQPADRYLLGFSDALGDPCLLLNRRGLIVHRNPIAAREFPSARAGDPLAFSFRNPNVLAAFDAARRLGAPQTVELHQPIPNETWHKVAIAPLFPRHGATAEEANIFVMTLQSLTEQKRVDAMRADFVANASHELRTPLTSLIGFIDTLLGPAAKDAQAREKFLHIMRAQAERMSKLIDDLLSLGRIEMRQHVLPTGKVELGKLLTEVCEGLQISAQEAGTMIATSAPEDPVVVIGDRDELYEVFENLLDNALKYGGDGGPVELELRTVANRPGYDVAVTVTDHGPGIAPEHVPRLTERFYRVDADTSRKKKGTGLGLAIVKHIVSRHRGLLTLKSRPGEGTRVEVLLKSSILSE